MSLKLWRSDKPQPLDYDQQYDPTQRVFIEDREKADYINRLSSAIQDWIADKSTTLFDSRVSKIKKSWVRSGGSSDIFDNIITPQAFLKSGYYKTMSKG